MESQNSIGYDKPLSSTARSSKWSINIQEIVKRTQRNLEKGSLGANQKNFEVNPKPSGITGLNPNMALYPKYERKPYTGVKDEIKRN